MGGFEPSTVLVVEDDASLRMLCRVNLDLEGYRVLEAESVERGRELLESESINVILLDLHLGEEHGLDLLPFLRDQRPETRICLLSGTSEAEPPRQEGVDAFIRKPFELDDLVETVRRLATKEPVRP